jgi:hypothetical protein
MKMRKLMTGTIAFLAGGATILMLLELVLRVVPVREGAYAAEPNAAWPAHTLIANSNYTFSTGWNTNNIHHGHINNFGYVSPFDYQEGSSGVVVIGDSFIESMMNEYGDALQGVLARELRPPQQVMNFGMSGADLAHYLGTAQLVGQHFTPSWAVLVITVGDYSGSFSTEPGYYRWAPERDPPIRLVPEIHRSPMTQFLRSLALVRYVRGNLAIRFEDLIHVQRAHGAKEECAYTSFSQKDEQITTKFVNALPRVLGLPSGHVILVFDSDRKALYAGSTPAAATQCPNIDQLARNRLMQLAATGGMRVIDSGPIFRDYYAATHQHLDFLPQDGHWNAKAHGLIAHAVAGVINDAPAPVRGSILSLAH